MFVLRSKLFDLFWFEWNYSMLLSVACYVILWSSLCLLLLHKWLTNSRKWMVFFLTWVLFENQLFSEGKLYSSTSLISTIALYIEIISLVNGMHGFIQEPDRNISEARVIVVELTEVLNPDLEELTLTDSIDSSKGKPWCIILLF